MSEKEYEGSITLKGTSEVDFMGSVALIETPVPPAPSSKEFNFDPNMEIPLSGLSLDPDNLDGLNDE
jgi:hypothetical protein